MLIRQLKKSVKSYLKVKGVFRVVCPDIDMDIRSLKNSDRHFCDWVQKTDNLIDASLEQLFIDHFAGSVSSVARNGGCGKKITDEEFKELLCKMTIEESMDYCVSQIDMDYQKKHRSLHMNWWNFKKLSSRLCEAGFKKVYRSQPWQSTNPVMRDPMYFDNFSNKVMLFVEAVRE